LIIGCSGRPAIFSFANTLRAPMPPATVTVRLREDDAAEAYVEGWNVAVAAVTTNARTAKRRGKRAVIKAWPPHCRH
jgi:hypothetical protein